MQKVSWFLRVSAVSALAMIMAVATLGSSSAAEAAVAATAAPTTAATAAAAPIVPVCVAAAKISEVRIVHASPNSPDVDIYVDGSAKPLLANVKFGQATPYMGVTAGAHHVKITKAGDAKTVVFDADVTLAGQTGYTLVAEGTLANFAVKVLTDDLSDTAGMARVVVVHAVPDAPAVDVITTKDNKAVVSNLAFPNSVEMNLDVVAMAEAAAPVATAAATAKAGATAAATPAAPTGLTVDLAVVAHGDTKPLIALPKTTLKADTIYTVIAIGLVGDKTNKAVKLEALVLTASSFAGFKVPPAPAAATAAAPVATAAAPAATMAATAAAPAATMAATKSASVDEAALAATAAATAVATVAAPVPTKIPVGEQPASAGWALKTGTLRRISDNSRCVGVAGVTVVGGPADVAGVKTGDLVLTVDGVELKSAEQFQTIIGAKKSGDKLKLELQHADGSQSATTIELGLNPFS
jgi:hypothetical protein